MSATSVALQSTRPAGHARPPWDYRLLGAVLVLMLLGLVMTHSASVAYAEHTWHSSTYYLFRHLFAITIALGAMFIVMYTRIRIWESLGPYLLLLGICSLLLVLLPGIGTHVNGSARWIRIGVFNIQPSEFVKLFLVTYIAGYLVRKQAELRNFTQGILMISIVVAVIGMLLLQEPDFGAVVVITVTVFAMLFLAGVRFWHFMIAVGAGLGGMVALTLISPYRMERVVGFLNPWDDPFNSGFQLIQALIAFGRGEWLGVGLGASVQKLAYLPAAHTDFLLAVLAEELGLIGVLAVIFLFAVVTTRAFVISRRAEQAGLTYAARLAQGIGLLLSTQAIINMGVNMGVLPTKGLTLPFMSYGGSSMLVCAMGIGLLLRVERETRARLWGER